MIDESIAVSRVLILPYFDDSVEDLDLLTQEDREGLLRTQLGNLVLYLMHHIGLGRLR